MKGKIYWKAGLMVASLTLAAGVARAQVNYTPYTFSTLAGLSQSGGTNDGLGSAARFTGPRSVTVDGAGNLYVVGAYNHTVRKITPTGFVSTIAGAPGVSGTNDGIGTDARFTYPDGITMDSSGNLFTVDQVSTVRRLSLVGTNWVVTTIAGEPNVTGTNDGAGLAAYFDHPFGIATDQGGTVYVADTLNGTIRKLTPSGTNWDVTTIAGRAASPGTNDGLGLDARFRQVSGLKVDAAGNILVLDSNNNLVRQLTPAGTNWVVTTLAGQGPFLPVTNDGIGTGAQFNEPADLAIDGAGNVYITDSGNYTIRKMSRLGTNWLVTTLAGLSGVFGTDDGAGANARFFTAAGIAVDGVGNVYVTDSDAHTIRRGFPTGGVPRIFVNSQDFGLQNGHFGFAIAAPAGDAAVVEASDNLSAWQPIWTNIIGAGALPFLDPNSAGDSRFYRARKP
jgi:sugar lactone lactonase YvrE